jgi:GNAT superfamily N-acetyltransferase
VNLSSLVPLLRPAVEADIGYVRGTWGQSYMMRLSGREKRLLPKTWPIWRELDAILRTRPIIIVLPGSGDTVHAWACAAPGVVLHYAYVPKDLRGHGIGRMLITAAFGSYPDSIPLSFPHRLDRCASLRFVRPPRETPWKSRISTK